MTEEGFLEWCARARRDHLLATAASLVVILAIIVVASLLSWTALVLLLRGRQYDFLEFLPSFEVFAPCFVAAFLAVGFVAWRRDLRERDAALDALVGGSAYVDPRVLYGPAQLAVVWVVIAASSSFVIELAARLIEGRHLFQDEEAQRMAWRVLRSHDPERPEAVEEAIATEARLDRGLAERAVRLLEHLGLLRRSRHGRWRLRFRAAELLERPAPR